MKSLFALAALAFASTTAHADWRRHNHHNHHNGPGPGFYFYYNYNYGPTYPRPMPPPPSYSYLGTEYVTCESYGRGYNSCPVSGVVITARIEEQFSSRDCIRGESYGFSGNQIWVDNGCRATFYVRVRY